MSSMPGAETPYLGKTQGKLKNKNIHHEQQQN